MQSLREAHPATPEFVRCQTAAATSASKKVTFELSPSSLNIASLPPKVAVIADKTCQPVGIDETKRQRRNSDEANKVRSCELVETWLRSGTISSMKYYPPETRQKLPAAPGSSNVTINGSIKNEYSNMMDNTVPRSPHSICPDSPVCVSHGATASILRQEAFADTESGASDDEEFSQLQRVLEISLKEARERAGLGTGQVFYTVEDKVVPNASDNDDDEYYDDEDTDLDDEYAWNAADDYDEDEALAKAIEVSRRDFEEKDCKLARCE
ncbi:hypothetical protein HDU84_004745 [Entophlyctis sp. JEL0112]|nr:hypothetical protein HDU84_004745 [Entophlyctis sp. JEL0112]